MKANFFSILAAIALLAAMTGCPQNGGGDVNQTPTTPSTPSNPSGPSDSTEPSTPEITSFPEDVRFGIAGSTDKYRPVNGTLEVTWEELSNSTPISISLCDSTSKLEQLNEVTWTITGGHKLLGEYLELHNNKGYSTSLKLKSSNTRADLEGFTYTVTATDKDGKPISLNIYIKPNIPDEIPSNSMIRIYNKPGNLNDYENLTGTQGTLANPLNVPKSMFETGLKVKIDGLTTAYVCSVQWGWGKENVSDGGPNHFYRTTPSKSAVTIITGQGYTVGDVIRIDAKPTKGYDFKKSCYIKITN